MAFARQKIEELRVCADALDGNEEAGAALTAHQSAPRTRPHRFFVVCSRERGVAPHVAQNTTNWRSAIDGRTARHRGYAVSVKTRAGIEAGFG